MFFPGISEQNKFLSVKSLVAMFRTSRCCSCITALFIFTGIFCNAKSIFETADSNISNTWSEQTDDCRPEEFTCSSGQCVDKTLLCDNKRDCDDGSDEPYENCEQNSFSEQDNSTVSGSCVLPEKPDNGDFTKNDCAHNNSSLICNTVSSSTVPNSTVLSYICDTNYKIKGNEHITCLMGQWSSYINTSCETACGGRRDGDIPWHVSVFRYTESGIVAKICNGVLVSDSLVVSAAHCFWQYRTFWQFPRELFVVSAEEKMDSYTGNSDGKKRKLKEVKFMDNYDPKTLSNDIALLRLYSSVEATPKVSPICIDWDNIHEKVQLVDGNVGSITVPVSTENINQNQTFQETQLSFVDFEKCLNEISEQKQFLTQDKFCANSSNNGNRPCSAINGAGLMFETDGLWYLRGIVSKGLAHKYVGPICTNHLIGLTRISDFLDFLK